MADPVEALFDRLNTALKNGQNKRALKAADEILKAAPGDVDALRSKVYLLVESGGHEEALKLVSAPPLAADMAFEKAYCLYRQGKLQDALAALQSVPAERELARLQLEAQIQYRLGAYKEAIGVYSQLFRAHGGEAGAGQEVQISPKDSFEIAFNAACGLLEAGDLPAAEQQLQLALRVGEEALYDEELAEEEVALELAPVTAQLAFVADRLGRGEEATTSYESLLQLDLDDASTASVATNNLYAALLRKGGGAGGRKVAGEAVKKLDAFMERSGGLLRLKPALEARLGPAQREALLCSYAACALLAGKNDVAKEAVRSIDKQLSGSPAAAMLQASLLSREGKGKEADAVLAALVGGDAAQAAEAALMRAQLAAASGDAAGALKHLEGIQDAAWQARPAVLATKIALLDSSGQAGQAAATLSSALQHWRADPDVLSKYAGLAAVCDPAAAAELGAQLPRASGMSAAELDSLENTNIAITAGRRRPADEPAVPVPASQKAAGAAEAVAAAEGERKKRKRKRQPRYPKGFDPANPGPPPDPERWLPKWQRSDAKKLRKKMKGKDAVKGSQGAGKVDESLDRTGAVDEPDSKGKAPARPPPGKKKGKGRR
ncbi:hypothetical protein COHA_009853 [Chlorella ohadii]|uniref:Signal recognition particle subunit SRP72 n=1 Tax=Chlorella ohadii TaxID=2649997 RepID=A0AAD5DH79_9CHLO|nr:hypothetical protein COHA_009853 [Chlorella ohadii]